MTYKAKLTARFTANILLFILCWFPFALNAQQDTIEFKRAEQVDSLEVPVGGGALGKYNEAYYQLERLNEGLSSKEINLQTPQATLEYFYREGKQGNFEGAGHALNLNLFPKEEHQRLAPRLAKHLFYVIDKQLGFDWEGLPDRPDALKQAASPNDPMAGKPRRSIEVGFMQIDGHDVTIRLQRVKVGDASPIWVFSPQSVENIEALYQAYGPGPLEKRLPEWAKVEIFGETALWAWLAFILLLLLAFAFGKFVSNLIKKQLNEKESPWVSGIGDKISTPLAFTIASIMIYSLGTIFLSLPGLVNTILLILMISSIIWLAMRFIKYLSENISQRQVSQVKDLSDNKHTRQQRWLTYLSVGRRVLLFILFVVGAGIIASQFSGTKTLGITLLASAGVLTVLLGIAAQPVLGNIIASIQIAIAKPVRIGDSVYFEGQWGYIEDIQYTFVLIQTWDQRRVIVPVTYFITHPVENWTMRDAHIIKPITLHADYMVDVDKLRDKFTELLKASDDWDEKQQPKVQVLDIGEETVEIRALCSAKDPSTAWDLHCRLREELLKYLREMENGNYLPKQRTKIQEHKAETREYSAAADD